MTRPSSERLSTTTMSPTFAPDFGRRPIIENITDIDIKRDPRPAIRAGGFSRSGIVSPNIFKNVLIPEQRSYLFKISTIN